MASSPAPQCIMSCVGSSRLWIRMSKREVVTVVLPMKLREELLNDNPGGELSSRTACDLDSVQALPFLSVALSIFFVLAVQVGMLDTTC